MHNLKTLLFTDLDGTLIFSAAKRTDSDIIVEYRDDTPISCITAFQKETLPLLRGVIPVTTRSIEQYKRIRFPFGAQPRLAITDNGGNLLINGEPQAQWAAWAKAIYAECAEELSAARAALEADSDRCFELRLVDGLFLFTKSREPEKTTSRLGGLSLCEGFFTGQKVYVIPKKLNKGAAARRLLELLRGEGFCGRVFCAGDSRMDIPLLNIADAALFADDLPESEITAAEKLSHPREGFTEFVTRTYFSMQE